ncbi:condensation domain-containing protein [Streptomyces sp. NPDC050509]|uniref:condensation domain-containing protein n=1 Tax=Streptomyces sp. NPDC050509 TaxID=3365620 RepID=UPI0037AD059C
MTAGSLGTLRTTVDLAFAAPPGGAQGVYAATWGQQEMWHKIAQHRPGGFYQLSQIIPVGEPRSLDTVLECLRHLVGRHASLRTTFHEDAGGLFQVIHRDGVLPVRVEEAPGEGRERATAAALVDGFQEDEPLLDREFAPRLAVVTRGGAATYLVLVCSHVVLDGHSERVLASELRTLLAAADAPAEAEAEAEARTVLPPVGHGPAEQAGAEARAKSRRTSARSVAYWRATLADAPPALFPSPTEPSAAAPIWCGRLASEALATAEATLVRSGLGSGALWLSAVARVLAAHTGRPATTFRLPVSNRFDQALDGYVGNLSQHTVVTVDTAAGTFRELARRVERDLMRAYFHARYDPAELAEATTEIESRRGAPLDLTYLFNDVRSRNGKPRAAPADPATAEAEESGESGESGVSWELLHSSNSDIKLHVRVTETRGRPRLDIAADTSCLSRSAITDALFAVERLLVEAAREAEYGAGQGAAPAP